MDTPTKEPAINVGLVTSVLTAVWVVVNNLWPHLVNVEVQNAINQIAVIVVPLIVGWIIRQKVWSPASVAGLQVRLKSLEAQNKSLSMKAAEPKKDFKDFYNEG